MLEIQCIIIICIYTYTVRQILRAGSVNRGEWSRFYLQNKAFMRIIAHTLQLYPFLYLSFKESFLNSKGKLLQKYESFFFFLLNKTRERPSCMYPPANMGIQISLSFFVLVLVAVLRKEERWTLKCQLALTSANCPPFHLDPIRAWPQPILCLLVIPFFANIVFIQR